MIYAVVIEPSQRVRGYYTEKKLAQEHADFINNPENWPQDMKKSTAKVITIHQERDEKEL